MPATLFALMAKPSRGPPSPSASLPLRTNSRFLQIWFSWFAVGRRASQQFNTWALPSMFTVGWAACFPRSVVHGHTLPRLRHSTNVKPERLLTDYSIDSHAHEDDTHPQDSSSLSYRCYRTATALDILAHFACYSDYQVVMEETTDISLAIQPHCLRRDHSLGPPKYLI